MWIFFNDAFLSIVADRNDDVRLLVRARIAGDIERAFPEAEVRLTPHADYPYRASVRRDEVAAALASRANEIAYANFKSSVGDARRHDAYMDVWTAMRVYQGSH
ncbi:MAG: hypothetical protein ACXVAM_18880 [Vulcanimicrobiaceae bacterium]